MLERVCRKQNPLALLLGMYVGTATMEKSICCCLITQVCLILQTHGLQPTRLLCPWDCPDKNAGVGHHFLLQGIFPSQGSNLCLFTTESPRKSFCVLLESQIINKLY